MYVILTYDDWGRVAAYGNRNGRPFGTVTDAAIRSEIIGDQLDQRTLIVEIRATS